MPDVEIGSTNFPFAADQEVHYDSRIWRVLGIDETGMMIQCTDDTVFVAPEQWEALQEEDERNRKLGMDRPWSAIDTMRKLCDAADHLLNVHDCDHHGYESIMAARDAGRRFVEQWSSKEVRDQTDDEFVCVSADCDEIRLPGSDLCFNCNQKPEGA